MRGGLVAAAALTALSRWTPIFDPDCFWHLHTGRFIAVTHTVPWVDAFSHTARGRPWRFIDIAADLLLYGAWEVGGAAALVSFTLLLGAAAVVATLVASEDVAPGDAPSSARAAALWAVAPWLVVTVAFRLTPRPQTFTFVTFAALIALCLRAADRPRRLWAIPCLVAVWQNLHPSGPLAVLTVAGFTVGEVIDARPWRSWVWVSALSAMALWVCPHPWDRLAAGFGHVADAQLAAQITEWQPLWAIGWRAPSAIGLVGLLMLALVGVPRFALRRRSTGMILVAAGVTVMAFRAVRFIPLAGIALTPLALQGALVLWSLSRRTALAVTLLAAVGLGGLATLYSERKPFGHGVQRSFLPVAAAEFVARTNPRGNLVHDFEMGGYLMWTLGPRHPVFVDGRSWALYDTAFLRDALALSADRLASLVPRYDLGLAVIWTEARVGWFQNRPGWWLVHLDDVASVLVRASPENTALIARYGYRELHPTRWFEDIARFTRDRAALDRAQVESARLVGESPDSAVAWVLRASVQTAAGDEAGADESAARALRLRPDMTPPHRMMMLRCAARGDRGCACREARRVVVAAPRNAHAREVLSNFGCEHVEPQATTTARVRGG